MGLDWLTKEGLTVDPAVVGVKTVELEVIGAATDPVVVCKNLNLALELPAMQVILEGKANPGEV